MAHLMELLFLSTLSLRRATSSIDDLEPSTTHFYPRSPCGERLWANFSGFYWWVISIHALLAESDHPKMSDRPHNTNFYPRSPCGERPSTRIDTGNNIGDFYPRSPCGERRPPSVTPTAGRNFYPRSPCGERRTMTTTICTVSKFLSTLSLRRATWDIRLWR